MEGPASITLETTPRARPLLPALPPPRPGAFLFDLLLPPDYPRSPPRVQFLTTGGGRVRFNPNLYEVRLEGGRERGGVLSFYAFFASRLWRQAGAVQPKPVRGEAGREGRVVSIPLFLCSAFYGYRRVRFNPNLYEVRLGVRERGEFFHFVLSLQHTCIDRRVRFNPNLYEVRPGGREREFFHSMLSLHHVCGDRRVRFNPNLYEVRLGGRGELFSFHSFFAAPFTAAGGCGSTQTCTR